MKNPPIKLLDRVRNKIRLKHYSIRTEKAYIAWIKRYIRFHNMKHPIDMGQEEIEAFLTHLAVQGNVSSSTQNQAFNALLFLYRHVLKKDVIGEINALRAKKPQRLPTVLSVNEVMAVIDAMSGTFQLIAKILYGCGLRGIECVRLRVQDIDFELNHIMVRDAKGNKDRATVFPDEIKKGLEEHLRYGKRLHGSDLSKGFGRVYLPDALATKYRNADKEWGWQYAFPSKTISIDPRSGIKRRHHIHLQSLNRTIKQATTVAGIKKNISSHTFTVLRRICFKMAMISEPSRNCSVTRT